MKVTIDVKEREQRWQNNKEQNNNSCATKKKKTPQVFTQRMSRISGTASLALFTSLAIKALSVREVMRIETMITQVHFY